MNVFEVMFVIRLPFIENIEYMDLRRKILKVLVQIRVLLRNLRLVDQINMPKSKLIVDVQFDSLRVGLIIREFL